MPRISSRSAFAPCDISVQVHASFASGAHRPRPGRQGGWAAALLAAAVIVGLPGCAAVDSVMAPPPVEPKVAAPAPTYASAEAAQAIADAARAERAAAVDAYTARVRECMHTFFATSCADKAREQRNTITERADVTRQQAELFVRQEKARVHREGLAAENARRDARDAEATAARQAEAARAAQPPARPAGPGTGSGAAGRGQAGRGQAGAATPSAGTSAPSASPAASSSAASSPAASAPASEAPAATAPSRAAPAAPSTGATSRGTAPGASLSAAEQAENRAAFEKKQAEAKAYADKRAEERKENEDKRERRRAAREADAAKFNAPAATPATPPTQGKQ